MEDIDVMLKVELDTTNMIDTTRMDIIDLVKLKHLMHTDNPCMASLIRMVQTIENAGYTTYQVVYQIMDNEAVKNIKIIE